MSLTPFISSRVSSNEVILNSDVRKKLKNKIIKNLKYYNYSNNP